MYKCFHDAWFDGDMKWIWVKRTKSYGDIYHVALNRIKVYDFLREINAYTWTPKGFPKENPRVLKTIMHVHT